MHTRIYSVEHTRPCICIHMYIRGCLRNIQIVTYHKCIHAYIYTHMHVKTYLCVSMYVCIYLSTYLPIYPSIYISIHTYLYINMYMYAYVCVYVYIILYVHVYRHICTYAYTYTYIYIYMYMYVFSHIYIFIYLSQFVHIYVHIYVYVCICSCIHVDMSVYMYIHIYIWLSIHVCAHYRPQRSQTEGNIPAMFLVKLRVLLDILGGVPVELKHDGKDLQRACGEGHALGLGCCKVSKGLGMAQKRPGFGLGLWLLVAVSPVEHQACNTALLSTVGLFSEFYGNVGPA